MNSNQTKKSLEKSVHFFYIYNVCHCFLVDPEVYVIVPEKFIFNLDEQSLKNVGEDGNFKYKVFYAENCVDKN